MRTTPMFAALAGAFLLTSCSSEPVTEPGPTSSVLDRLDAENTARQEAIDDAAIVVGRQLDAEGFEPLSPNDFQRWEFTVCDENRDLDSVVQAMQSTTEWNQNAIFAVYLGVGQALCPELINARIETEGS